MLSNMMASRRPMGLLALLAFMLIGCMVDGALEVKAPHHRRETHHCVACCTNHHVAAPVSADQLQILRTTVLSRIAAEPTPLVSQIVIHLRVPPPKRLT